MTTLRHSVTSAGFFGKLPARGDFVRSGLSRDFVDPWDAWLQHVLSGSQDTLGDAWPDAWLQAPIWRFALPPGLCGAAAVLGLWMPSVDRAGRYFPLTIALTTPGGWGSVAAAGGGFLDEAERAGLAALEQDLPPEALGERIAAALSGPVGDSGAPMDDGMAAWWTDGSPLVPASVLSIAGLPDTERFTSMIAGHQDTAWP